MRGNAKTMLLIGIMASLVAPCRAVDGVKRHTRRYIVTNDDVYGPAGPNTATFYRPGGTFSTPNLSLYKTIQTGGTGTGDGAYGTNGIVLVQDAGQSCAFVSDAESGDIAGIALETQKVIGNFKGSQGDNGFQFGIGLSANSKYLFAAYTGSSTIGMFKILPGCKLRFVSDVSALGAGGGGIVGMGLHADMLVTTYTDGSIQSFNVSGGIPVSNNDLQYSTGFKNDGGSPDGVDITRDGHYAIFGDASTTYPEVEVSDISSGKLTPTVEYGGASGGLGGGKGTNSNNVWLSPDESLLYISLNWGGEVAAAFFDKNIGTLSKGCFSGILNGYQTEWAYTASLATERATGTGGVLWVAEDGGGGGPSAVGIVKVSSSNGQCTLTESADSPAYDYNSSTMRSIVAYPSRPF